MDSQEPGHCTGTHWPSMVYIRYHLLPPTAGPRAQGKMYSLYAGEDPVEFMRELFDMDDEPTRGN